MSTDPKKSNADALSQTSTPASGIDDVIIAPRGGSKTRFLMTFLLVIILLTTFTVSDQLVEVLGLREARGKDYITWNSPDGTKKTLDFDDFTLEKRALGLLRGRGSDLKDDDAAFFIVLDDAATHAGVRISDGELKESLETAFGNAAQYTGFVQSLRTTKAEFEAILRRDMRTRRFQGLLSAAFVGSDPEAAAKNWRASHQEVAYDFVELPVAGLEAEARAAAPQGEELNKWFTERPPFEQDKYKTQAAVAAELAAFVIGDVVSSAKLLAKYPLAADFDSEKAARDFHTAYGYSYFKNTDPNAANSPLGVIIPFEDVKDRATELAKAQAALDLWIKDLLTRTEKSETIDLAAEAVALELGFRTQLTPLTLDGWQQLGMTGLGPRSISAIVHSDRKQGFVPNVLVDEKAFLVTRILQRDSARMPEFAEIADRVAADWAKARAQELAIEKLKALRERISTKENPTDPSSTTIYTTDSEKLAAAAKDLGFEVKKRAFKDRSVRMMKNENPTPSDLYLQSTPALAAAPVGMVPEVGLNADKSVGFLVLVAGQRDPDDSKMNVSEFQNSLSSGNQMARFMFEMRTFRSREFFQQQYGLNLKAWADEQAAPKS